MLEEFSTGLLPYKKYKGMCSMVEIVREVRSWTDYILDMDHRLLRNMSIWDPMHT